MKTLTLVRHQRAGVLTECAFEGRPTEAQLAPVLARLERLHGRSRLVEDLATLHTEPVGDYLPWYTFVDLLVCERDEVPSIALPPEGPRGRGVGAAVAGSPVPTGTGSVG